MYLPPITVIVPVYNNPAGIKSLITSLLKLNYPRNRLEIIIVDNNSADDTASVIKQYPVRYVFESLPGSYSARNKGIRSARGEIIAFTDSDCSADSAWVHAAVSSFSPDVAAISGRIKFSFRSRNPDVCEYLDSSRKLDQKSYIKKGFAVTANFFVRRRNFDKYGLFRGDLISGGDYEFGRRLTMAGEKIIYCPQAVVTHPARNSFRQLSSKTVRIGRGQKQLSRIGLLAHDKLDILHFAPVLNPPRNRYYQYFTAAQKVRLLVIANIIKYANIAARLG